MESGNSFLKFSYFSYWAQLPPILRTTSAQVGSQSATAAAEAYNFGLCACVKKGNPPLLVK